MNWFFELPNRVSMDSRLRGNDPVMDDRHCHSREGGNPFWPEQEVQKSYSLLLKTENSSICLIRFRRILRKNNSIIFLNASYESIKDRLSDLDTRGIVGLKTKGLERLYKERFTLYQRYADITITLPDDINVKNIISEIKSLFG